MNDDNDIPARASSGNIFADFGRPDAEEALARVQLAQQIAEIIERQGLSQAEAAAIIGLDQPKISALVRGRLSGFSTDRLLRCLTLLGQDSADGQPLKQDYAAFDRRRDEMTLDEVERIGI